MALFAPVCDKRVPHIGLLCCGLAFLFGANLPLHTPSFYAGTKNRTRHRKCHSATIGSDCHSMPFSDHRERLPFNAISCHSMPLLTIQKKSSLFDCSFSFMLSVYLTSNSAVRRSFVRDEGPTITLNVPGSTTRFISRL